MDEFIVIFFMMGEQDDLFGTCAGRKEMLRCKCAFINQLLWNKLIFLHGKTVVFRQGMRINGVESNFNHRENNASLMGVDITDMRH